MYQAQMLRPGESITIGYVDQAGSYHEVKVTAASGMEVTAVLGNIRAFSPGGADGVIL